MKLSDIKGEKAIEVIADLIDPFKKIASDGVFREKIASDRVEGVKYLLKHHAKTVIEILAVINEEDPQTYEPNVFALPVMLLDFFNDPMVSELFGFQSQTMDKTSSGSVTESTEAPEA